MEQHAVGLEHLPGTLVDLDVASDKAWLAVCRRGADLVVASETIQFAVPTTVRFPVIRWMPRGEILLIDSRTTTGSPNAILFTSGGLEKTRFCVGDAVEDAVVVGDWIVITYFDEGLCGPGPSQEGLCVFTADGRLDFGYLSGVTNPVRIADCYCACAAGGQEVCFSPYPDFPLVRLNLGTRRQEVSELPGILAGASALTTDGGTYYLHSPYAEKHAVYRWHPTEVPVKVGTHVGPLRGLPSGEFLALGTPGYTLVRAGPSGHP